MSQEANHFESDEELTSVPSIPAANENGHPYVHYIEPELAQTALTRRVERPTLKWSASHKWVLNIGLGFGLSFVYIGRQFHASNTELFLPLSCIVGVIGALMLLNRVGDSLITKREFDFLKYGVATVGVFASGAVYDCEGTTYRLVYTFHVEGRLHTNTVEVSRSDYIRYTKANPYFTVLYRGKRLVDSVPYFQIAGVGIIV